jgi:hypothetical protein
MTTPSPRNPIRIARGLYADLLTSLADLKEGEICYAKDQNSLYVIENGVLTPIVVTTSSIIDSVREITGMLEVGEPMGHTDRTQSNLSFNSTTRTFSISPVSTSFEVWCRGIKHTYFSTESISIPNSTGLYYFFFDQNGVIQYDSDFFNLEFEVPTAYVYWNASTGQVVYFADERHGITLDWQTHEYLHRTRGAAYANGFDIVNYTTTGSGSLDSDAQFDLIEGTFFDEDLEIRITHSNSPAANSWQQDLQGPARIPVLWRNGSSWTLDSSTNFVIKAGTTRPVYNLNTAGNWSVLDASANKYLTVYITATNNLNHPIISILGQNQYNNIADALAVHFANLDLSDFPSLEFRPLYQIIYQVNSYSNSIRARFRDVIDYRVTGALSGVAVTSGVSNINGLTDVDTITTPPTNRQSLAWDAATNLWIPTTINLADLSDTDISGKIDKSVMTYNEVSSKFVASDIYTILTITDGGNF